MEMKLIHLMLVGMLVITGCATAGHDIKATSVVDAKVNLAGYKTYNWLASAEVLNDPHGNWVPLNFDVDKEVRWLIDKQLREKKMTYAAGIPDAYVVYVLGVDMDSQAEEIRKLFGEKADLSNLTAGSLLIVLIDSQTQQAIWAGAAVAQTQMNLADEMVRARLAAAVDKIFDHYSN
jgi:hypothetical protein